ncbi:MAG: S8 family serine peptidase, partial [Bdellovibrionaceae bacterium]|nr:S8 family serine peptidase [Pseudobdellovibrionaceae bacterium]
MLSILSQFQNCGKTPGSSAATSGRVSPQSPFYDQRVRLDLPEDSVVKATTSDNEKIDKKQVSVLLHNSCAQEACTVSDDPKSSIACRILEQNEVLDKLGDSLQAYNWELESATESAAFEKTIRENFIDDQCIVGVSYNIEYKIEAYTTNDPGYPSQYYHKTINGPEAYEFFNSQGLPTVNVAVIDTGIDATHEDIYYSGSNTKIGTSCDDLCHWHGNFVSGIISGRRNNSKGGQGIAQNAYIYSFQIGDKNGNLTTTELVNALQVSNTYPNIDIVNLSLGGSGLYDFGVQDAVMSAISKGRLVVVSAGNNGADLATRPIYPAAFNFDGQITVASASPNGVVGKTMPLTDTQINSTITRDTFSNYNSGLVHIAAPGSNIYSTTLNNTYGVYNGTSFSAPMVTGALALAKGYLKKKGYDVSPQMLRSLLFDGSRTESSLIKMENGIAVNMVQNNRYLDLTRLKNTLVAFTASANAQPGRIELVNSSVTTVNGQQVVRIRVDVRDADLNAGLVLSAYTNSSMLTQSFTGYTCNITNARQICDIEISYAQLFASPEVYLRVANGSGAMISDLKIPKTAINLGNKALAALKGEIVAAYHFDKSFEIEGW